MARKLAILLPIIIVGLALDVATKLWVLNTMPLNSHIPVIPGWFDLVHIHNKGAAFGLLSNWGTGVARWFFVGTTSVVVLVVGLLWWRTPGPDRLAQVGYGLILAGALGNLADRVRLGEVVDFLDFYWRTYHWPAFNVADSLVCIGAGVLVWVIFRDEKKDADVSHSV
jgi:signal peptidase II